MKRTDKYIWMCSLLSIMLLTACSDDDKADKPKNNEITLNADVWRMMDGTRATLFSTGTLSSGSFTAAAYVAESTTPYINPVTVNWETDKWVFSDGKHYWPASGGLDFFAYMPATPPSYITNGPIYTTARNPQFTCGSLPMTYNSASPTEGQGSDLQEFVYALKTNRTKALDGADGVTLSFQHPFAKIKFQLSESHRDIKVNIITLKDLKTGGTCTFDGSASTWSSLTGSADFEMFLNQECYSNPASTVALGPEFIVVPQDWAGSIIVSASWTDWGESFAHIVRATVPTEWEAGYSYTYTLTINTKELIVNTSKFTEQW